jgi:hypothetical protein
VHRLHQEPPLQCEVQGPLHGASSKVKATQQVAVKASLRGYLSRNDVYRELNFGAEHRSFPENQALGLRVSVLEQKLKGSTSDSFAHLTPAGKRN